MFMLEKGVPRHAHPSSNPEGRSGIRIQTRGSPRPSDEPGLVPRHGSPAWHRLQPSSPCQALPPWQTAASFWLLSALRVPESCWQGWGSSAGSSFGKRAPNGHIGVPWALGWAALSLWSGLAWRHGPVQVWQRVTLGTCHAPVTFCD